MFAPTTARVQTEAAEASTRRLAFHRSALVKHRLGREPVGPAPCLQRTIGNQATLRLLSQRGLSPKQANSGDQDKAGGPENVTANETRPGVRPWPSSPVVATPLQGAVQTKLVVGPTNDPLEHDADRAADQVMRMPAPPPSPAPPRVDQRCAGCEDQDGKKLQRKETGGALSSAATAPPIVGETLGEPGAPLDASTRAFFEPRFGQDFSQVRVHTSGGAALASRQIGAQAFTYGSDIFYAAGKSPSNNALTAHELAHVVQQHGGADPSRAAPTGYAPRSGASPASAGVAFLRVQRLPGDGIRPPGDCAWPRYVALRLSVETAKAITDTLGGCSAGDSCERKALKIAAIAAEIAAREAVAVACFKGGDTGHQEQIANKIRAFNACVATFSGSNCSPELIKAQEAVVEAIRGLLALGAATVAAALVVALIVAIIELAQVIAALIAAAAAAAAEAAVLTAAAAAVIALLVRLKNFVSSDGPGA